MKTLRGLLAGVFATLFVLFAGPALAQGPLRVDGFDVEQVAELSPGTQLNFSVFGTPGAQATLRIDGSAAPLTLTEVQPGVYEGSHTITEWDRIMPESRVVARLRLHDDVAVSQLGEPLLLGMDSAPVAETALPPHIDSAPVAEPVLAPPQSFPPARAGRPVPPPPNVERADLPAPPYCADCGVVEAINRTGGQGGRGHVGAVIGGVFGAIVGNQVGRGEGRTVARILGALGGALAGREIERRNAAPARYEMLVRLDGGARHVVGYDSAPPFRIGDRVRFAGGNVRLADGSVRPYR